MSTSSPLSPNAPFDDDPKGGSTPGPQLSSFPTRTVAIIKTHALVHRFDIERRIQEASFEVRFRLFNALSWSGSSINACLDCEGTANGNRCRGGTRLFI